MPEIFYSLPFPRTKVISYPVVLITGFIDKDGITFHFENERGCLGSIWGRRYDEGWAYFHCNRFDPQEAFLEGVAGTVFVSPRLFISPFLFTISVDKSSFRYNRLRDLFINGCRWEKGRIVFWRRGIYTRIFGEITCREQDIIGGVYDDVDDTYVYCYHTEVGDCSITIENRGSIGSPWNTLYRLSSSGLCHFEYGSRIKDESARHVYELLGSL